MQDFTFTAIPDCVILRIILDIIAM